MVRTRITAGAITSKQLEQVSKIARQYGNGSIHITSRQDLQIHDVTLQDTSTILNKLSNCGIYTKGGGGNSTRNVITCNGASWCPHRQFDVTPYAIAATELLLQDEQSFRLPRKYKIAFSGCTNDCADAWATDVGFVATTDNEKTFFKLYAGGGLGSSAQPGFLLENFLDKSKVFITIKAIRDLFLNMGDFKIRQKARLRFVAKKLGRQAFEQQFQKFLKKIPVSTYTIKHQSLFDLTGQILKNIPWPAVCQTEPGLYQINLRPQDGDMTSEQAERTAALCERYNIQITLTQHQGLSFSNIKGEYVIKFLISLDKIFKNWRKHLNQKQPLACRGSDTCKLGMCKSKHLSRAITQQLRQKGIFLPENFPIIKISGCPNSCANHLTAMIGLQGGARRHNGKILPYYKVFSNAEKGVKLAEYAGGIPARNIPVLVEKLAKALQDNTEDYNYHNILSKLIKQFDSIPDFSCNPILYFDFGESSEYSIKNRSAGECGMGIIDIIEADIDNAQIHLNNYYETQDDHTLFNAGLHAARALLITKGKNPSTNKDVLKLFLSHFITSGIFDPVHKQTIKSLINFTSSSTSILPDAYKIDLLIKETINVYKSMDSSFNFKRKKTGTINGAEAAEKSNNIDLRGVACPINFVKAKLALERLPHGSILNIYLDDGAPIENVPASFKAQGQQVTKIDTQFNGFNILQVKKIK
jgi:sulfite reductase (ferredoxin)